MADTLPVTTKNVFKRWSRKPWAVFSSIGKRISIGVLSLSCILISLNALPQKNDSTSSMVVSDIIETKIELDEVVVSARLAPTLSSQLIRVVQVISRKEIENAGVNDLGSLLEFASGVDVRQRGVPGMQADISMRGGTYEQTLILLNGINMTDPQTGHHNLNLPVDLSVIERIEILRGPAARIHGPNAFNGAINIITTSADNLADQVAIKGAVYGGQHNTIGSSASIKINRSDFRHNLSFGTMKTHGYMPNTDAKNSSLYYLIGKSFGKAKIQLQAALNGKEYGANAFYSAKYPNQFEKIKSRFIALHLDRDGNVSSKVQLFWRRHQDRFELFRDNKPSWYDQHNYHLSDVLGGSAKFMFNTDINKITAGIDYRFEKILSNVLGDSLNEYIPVPGYSNVNFTNSATRQGINLYAENSGLIRNISYSIGFLVYANSGLNYKTRLFPGIDVGIPISSFATFFVSVNKTLRLPSFTDLYYSSPTNVGNRDLFPEEALSLETGFKYINRPATANISLFHRIGKNLIDWIMYPSENIWRSMNHTSVNITGFEVDYLYNFNYGNSDKFVSNLGLHYTFLHPKKNSTGYASLYVLDVLKHKVDINLLHKLTNKSGINWKISFQDRYGGFVMNTANQPSQVETSYKGAVIADAKIFYNLSNIQLYINISNFLNSRVFDHANVELPGIWINGGLKLNYLKHIKKS